MTRPEVSPADEPTPDPTPEPAPARGEDTAEHDTLAEAVAERLEGGPPPRDDPPEGERSDPHVPPLDRLEDYVHLAVDDPRRIEAARVLAGRAEGDRPAEAS